MEKPCSIKNYFGYIIERGAIYLLDGKEYYASTYVDDNANSWPCLKPVEPVMLFGKPYDEHRAFFAKGRVFTGRYRNKLSKTSLSKFRSSYMRNLNRYRKYLKETNAL